MSFTEITQYNPKENFFDQLPYDVVCHIFKFIEKEYDIELLKLNYWLFNTIINEDKYIDKFRKSMYSFGLSPEDHRLSGTAYQNRTWSRVDEPSINLNELFRDNGNPMPQIIENPRTQRIWEKLWENLNEFFNTLRTFIK